MRDRGGSRGFIFGLQIVYLLLLVVIGVLDYFFHARLQIPNSLGLVPVAVPWFGALGATLISLTGVFQHAKDWDPEYKYWHWSRPMVGAIISVIAVLIFQIGFLSVAVSGPSQDNRFALYYVLAFLVAYREETFRELIKRVTDIILTPAPPLSSPAITSVAPPGGGVAGGTQVRITGTGLSSVTAVRFGTQSAQYAIDSDAQLTVLSPPGASAGPVAVIVVSNAGSVNAGQFIYQ